MSVTFEQLKGIVIKEEETFLFEYHENDGQDSEPYIQEMKEDLGGCHSIGQLVDWYGTRGFDESEGYEMIIKKLMKATTLTKK